MMTTLTRRAGDGLAAAPVPARRRRRNGPLAVAGVLLVAGCALAFAAGWRQAGHRKPVLAVAHKVAAGQVFTAADLQVVRVSADRLLHLVPAGQEEAVVGHTAATTVPAGSLLSPSEIGAPALAAGQALLGVAVKPGQYPPDLSSGQQVQVLATPAATGASGSGSGGATAAALALPIGRAIVLSVTQQASSADITVVELQVSQDSLPQVAAAAADGQVALATAPAGG